MGLYFQQNAVGKGAVGAGENLWQLGTMVFTEESAQGVQGSSRSRGGLGNVFGKALVMSLRVFWVKQRCRGKWTVRMWRPPADSPKDGTEGKDISDLRGPRMSESWCPEPVGYRAKGN